MLDAEALAKIVSHLERTLQDFRLVGPADKGEIEAIRKNLNQILALFQDEGWLQKAGKVSLEFDRIAESIENLRHQLDSATAIDRLERKLLDVSDELQSQKALLNSMLSKFEENNDLVGINGMFKDITQALDFLKNKK